MATVFTTRHPFIRSASRTIVTVELPPVHLADPAKPSPTSGGGLVTPGETA
jgi:hypothetical protein